MGRTPRAMGRIPESTATRRVRRCHNARYFSGKTTRNRWCSGLRYNKDDCLPVASNKYSNSSRHIRSKKILAISTHLSKPGGATAAQRNVRADAKCSVGRCFNTKGILPCCCIVWHSLRLTSYGTRGRRGGFSNAVKVLPSGGLRFINVISTGSYVVRLGDRKRRLVQVPPSSAETTATQSRTTTHFAHGHRLYQTCTLRALLILGLISQEKYMKKTR